MTTQLDVNLACELDGRRVLISGSGRRVSIEVPDVRTAVKIVSAAQSIFKNPNFRSYAFDRLTDQRVKIEMISENRSLAAVGGQQSFLGRLIGLPNASVSFRLLATVVIESVKRRMRVI